MQKSWFGSLAYEGTPESQNAAEKHIKPLKFVRISTLKSCKLIFIQRFCFLYLVVFLFCTKCNSPYHNLLTNNARMALSTAITATPTSANTAIHISAAPKATSTSAKSFIAMAKMMF